MSRLSDDLARALDDARRRYAAFRPEVAEYLFDRGFRAAERATSDEALLTAIFRLQLESIGARTFGVSNDAWREHGGWPDRYFPILWLDLVPRLLPLLPSERRLPTVVALFNLGENLVTIAPSLGGAVADGLLARVERIAGQGLEAVALQVLAELGILPREAIAATFAPTSLQQLAVVSTAAWDASFLPGAIAFEAEGTFTIADRARPVALQLTRTGAATQLVARLPLEAPREPALFPLRAAALAVSKAGEVSFHDRVIGRVDPRGVAGAALGPHGLLVIARRFSQRVELWSAS